MNAFVVAGLLFAAAVAGLLLAALLQRLLPAHHLESASKEVVFLSAGVIATMAALVLGLLVTAAKATFDAEAAGFQELSTDLILLDRSLAFYGPEGQPARTLLRELVVLTIADLKLDRRARRAALADPKLTRSGDAFFAAILALKPTTDAQKSVQSDALDFALDLGRTRWHMTQPDEQSLPAAFLVILAFWLCALFASFGLYSPPNSTVITALTICALSIAGASFLIVDLDQPFEGLLRVSSAPLDNALEMLGQP